VVGHRADLRKIIARSVWKAGMETSDDLMTEVADTPAPSAPGGNA